MKSRLGKPEGDKVMGMVLARRNKGINSSFIIRSVLNYCDIYIYYRVLMKMILLK